MSYRQEIVGILFIDAPCTLQHITLISTLVTVFTVRASERANVTLGGSNLSHVTTVTYLSTNDYTIKTDHVMVVTKGKRTILG